MRVLIIGCGSIGTRRAKILAKMGHEIWCQDADVHRAVALAKGIGYPQRAHAYADWQTATPCEAALICTPPDSGRPEQIERCLSMGVRGLFVEKPLALDAREVSDVTDLLTEQWAVAGVIERYPDAVTMGACNLRFVGGISGLRKIKKPWRLAAFRMGQHRKYWSPKHQPISMILDSIHELDLAVHLNGPIESIRGYSETDVAEVSVHHEGGGLSHLHLDRVTDPPVRSVTITKKGDRDFLRLMTNDGMYQREMEHFIGCVEAGMQTCNPLRQAAEVCARALEVATG